MYEFLTLVTPPTAMAVGLNEMKTHLRVSGDCESENADINSRIKAAIKSIEGRDGWMGRALMTQTWKLALYAFPGCRKIKLPLPPLQSVSSIKYLDDYGVEQTMDSSLYRVVTDVECGFVELKPTASWPTPGPYDMPIRVQFVCGYGSQPDKVPEDIRDYIKVAVAEGYANREQNVVGTIITEIPHVRSALDNYIIRDSKNFDRVDGQPVAGHIGFFTGR